MAKASKSSKTAKSARKDTPHRAFWLVIASILGVTIWFVLWIFLYQVLRQVMTGIIDSRPINSDLYEFINAVGMQAVLLISGIIATPVVYLLYRSRQLDRPFIDAVGLMASIIFGLGFFMLLFSTVSFFAGLEGLSALIAMASIFAVSILLYGGLLRVLVRRISTTWLLVIMIGLPVVVLFADALYRLSVTPLL